MQRLKEPSEFVYQHTVVEFLNLVSGSSSHSSRFWADLVVPGLERRYGSMALLAQEKTDLQEVLRKEFQVCLACIEMYLLVCILGMGCEPTQTASC